MAAALGEGERQALVLEVFRRQLATRLDARIAAAQRLVESAFRTWADKYAVTLRDLEVQRKAANGRLERYLKELGYA
jgi:type I restriction enzyme M protein